MPGPLPVRFSRNMTVVREGGGRLAPVNAVRLDAAASPRSTSSARATDVIRLAANHGTANSVLRGSLRGEGVGVKGQRYTTGFNASAPETYFTPHVEQNGDHRSSAEGARLQIIAGQPPLLPEHGGLPFGHCLQTGRSPTWTSQWLAESTMRMMGFMHPYNIGPAWLRQTKPPRERSARHSSPGVREGLAAHG